MSEFLTEWFRGFEKGIARIGPKEKEEFFAECGRNCANTGIIHEYQKLYRESNRELDLFFEGLNAWESVSGRVVKPGQIYEVMFPRCLCDLHTLGYVNSDYICECSRQSIIYVMKSLKPECEFQVDQLTTVLSGDKECRFRITVLG